MWIERQPIYAERQVHAFNIRNGKVSKSSCGSAWQNKVIGFTYEIKAKDSEQSYLCLDGYKFDSFEGALDWIRYWRGGARTEAVQKVLDWYKERDNSSIEMIEKSKFDDIINSNKYHIEYGDWIER